MSNMDSTVSKLEQRISILEEFVKNVDEMEYITENDLYEKFKLIDHDNDDKYIDIKNLKIFHFIMRK